MCMPRGLAAGLLVLIGVWYLASLRTGHEWGDDFCLYLRHASNIADGVAYVDTGYIYNPSVASLSPRTYPPLFPLLLLPVYAWFGLNLQVMKAELVLLFLLFLAVVYHGFRAQLPRGARLLLVACLGLNPYFWDYKDRLLSEVPFLLFSYLALHFITRSHRLQRSGGRRWTDALLAGVSVYLACATRSVGVVLIPCLVLEGVWRERRLFNPISLITAAVFALGVLIQQLLLRLDASYLDQLVFDPTLFAQNALSLAKAMGLFAANGYSDVARVTLFSVLAVFAVLGFVVRLRTSPGVHEFFAFFYGIAIIVWPCSEWNQRFLLPLLPLYVAYVLHGLRAARNVCPRVVVKPVGIGLTAAILISYGGQYTRMEFGTLREGIGKSETVALFDFIRCNTQRDDVFIFQKPRALALFTGRRASALHTPDTDWDLWSYLGKINATHVVVSPLFGDSYRLLQPLVERYPDRLQKVFENSDFVVYQIESSPLVSAPPDAVPGDDANPDDTRPF